MPLFGKIVVIKRNGTDGTHFPLTAKSCTFGRTKECNIRIQLPQVSKEQCKIEVNENKEAILINLSTINPTQLNGSNFQQPMYLKHGDVLTIIDRSFRFEYPPAPLTRKRISRSEEKETLQVLHVQQLEQKKLHPQNSECKSLQISDEKLECEGQKTNGSDEQRTQDTTRQNGTNEATCKIRRSGRKSVSPFEFVNHVVDTKLAGESFSNKISIQQKAEYSPQKYSIDIVTSQTPHQISAPGQTIQTEETETVALENIEQPTGTEDQGISIVSSPMFVERNSFRRSSRILQTYTADERQDREEISVLDSQNVKENEDSEVIKSSSDDSNRKSSGLSTSCSIVALEYTEKECCYEKSINQSTETANVEVKTNLNTSGSKAGGERLETFSSPCSRQANGMLQTELDPLLELKSTAEISTEIDKGVTAAMTREDESGVLTENKYLKTNRNSKLLDIEQPLGAQILEESTMESDPLQDGHFETVACMVRHRDSKSPRRSSRQKRNVSNEGSIIMEKSLITVKDVLPFKEVPEENMMKHWPQKDNGYKEEMPTTKNLENNFVMKNIAGSSCLSESHHKSHVQMPAEDVVRKMNASNRCSIKKEPAVQKSPQKRKGGEADFSVQPLGKRKRVSFGGDLSPELFDKRLPPNSPLKRGAIPARFSLPFGNSPRAVLKKAPEFKQCIIKENRLSRKGSPAASPPVCRSPVTFSCTLPHVRGRFSVSHVDVPCLSSVEHNAPTREMDLNKEVKTPETAHQESQTASSVRRSNKFAPRKTSLHRRSGAMDTIRVKRQSGASEANLIVSRSWAEVVKQGVPKSQQRTTPKRGLKRRPAKKMPTKAAKSNVSSLKTPTRKIKGYFTTGHANSPAPIVVGKAHTSTINISAQVPKVMFNYTWKQQQDSDESFTGMTEMFHTPLNWKQGSSLPSVQKSNMSTPEEASEVNTPEESGEMAVSSLNVPLQQIYNNQDAESPNLKQVSEISTVGPHELEVPRGGNSPLDEIVGGNSSLVTSETVKIEEITNDPKEKSDCIEAHSRTKRLMRTPKQEPESFEALSGLKRLFRTPKQKTEPVEALSGVKRLLRTPKQKPESVETLSGVKRLLRTPKQKSEPVEALSGVKRLLRTPTQEVEPLVVLSGVKGLLRTPKEEPEPLEALSGIKRLLRTPKEESEPVEELSGARRPLRTPKEDSEPVEALSGVKRLLRTPKEESELVEELSGARRPLRTSKEESGPVEALSGVKRLLRTPKQKTEPVEAPSGVKRLLRTPKEELEPLEALSGIKRLFRTPKEESEPVEALSEVKRLLRTPKQKPEPVETLSGVKRLLRTPKQKSEPVEALSGVKRLLRTPTQEIEPLVVLSGVKGLLRTPKEEPEPLEALSGIKRLLRTPKEESEPVEALSGAKRLLRTPTQEIEPPVVLSGVKGLLRTPKEEPEPLEALSGARRPLRTPKQNPEPVETLSGVKRLLKTPKQKSEPVEALSGVKRLLRTPKEEEEPVEELSGARRPLRTPTQETEPLVVLSGVKGLLRTPKEEQEPVEELSEARRPLRTPKEESGVKMLLRTPKQKPQPIEALSEVKRLLRTPKPKPEQVELLTTPNHKAQPVKNDICSKFLNSPEGLSLNVTKEQKEKGLVDNMEGIQRLFRTPKQKFEPVEDMIGISRILKTPRQKFMPIDDYSGLQKLMAEPKQNSLSAETDYTGVKELFGPVDGYLVKLSESVNEPQENASSEFGCKEGGPEKEESQQETGLKDSFERKSPNAILRRPDDGHDELQDHFGHTSCSSHNDVIGAHVESITTVQFVPEKSKSDGTDLSEESSARQEDPVEINAEIPELLASVKKPKKGKAGESGTEEHHAARTSRLTRNSRRAKLANCMQTNKNSDQKVPETKDSESNFLVLETETTQRLREKSIETNGNMDLDNIRHSQELLGLSKDMSIEAQLPVNRRRVAAKLNRQAEERVHLEENAANEEDTNQCISKRSLRSRNPKNKYELKSEFTKTNPQEKMQSSDLETSERNCGNPLPKKNTRRRKASLVETEMEAINGDKHLSPKICKLETLENLPKEIKESAIRRKERRKVCFLLETSTSETLEEKYVFGGKSGTQQKQENASQKNKKKIAPVVSPLLCISFSSENPALAEISNDRENSTLTNDDPASFVPGECLQEVNCDKNANETQMVPWENTQKSVEHRALKRQKVAIAKKNPPTRGRSRAASPELPIENGSKVTPKTETQSVSVENAIFLKENQSKRGRRKVVPVSQTLGILSGPKEDPTAGSSDSAQRECLQGTQNEGNFNEVQKVCLDNTQSIAECILPKRQKATRRIRSQNDNCKQGVSYEPAPENNNKENPDVEKQDMVVENAFTAKENQPKRGRRRKLVSVIQTQEDLTVPKKDIPTSRSSFAQEECFQDTQTEKNSNETQKMVLNNTESSVEHILPKRQKVTRGNLPQRVRSKQVASHEPSTKNDKETPDAENQVMVAENAFSVKENQPKRGRGRKAAAVPQIVESDNFPLSSKYRSGAEEQTEALEMAATANKNPSHRGRSKKSFITSSVPASKQPRVVDNASQEEITSVLKDVTKENVSKRGRRKLTVLEASTETNIQRRATSKPTCVKGKKGSTASVFENQSKRSRGENIVLAFQTLSSPVLKISITSSSSLSDKNETASRNKNLFIEDNLAGKENLAINDRRNKKIVPRSKYVRRKCELPEEEECQEKQNVNVEKIDASNDRQSRRTRRKVGTSETVPSKEECGLPESSGGISKNRQVIMADSVSGLKYASQGRRKQILKGKNLPKHSDQKNSSLKNDLEITLPREKGNLPKRERRKQVSTELETCGTISDMKTCLFAEDTTSAPKAENTGSTLQRGRKKKVKEEHNSAIAESAVETQTKMKAIRRTRTRKQVL